MRKFLPVAQLIVGVLFIFSGLIKANDPSGLSYKMQEFFEVWGWHGFDDYTLALSVLMIAFEIIAGIAVLLGWRFPLFSWLLLLLILFFTFLTAYAQFSGKIRECGCFGDCIKLTALDSFIKDLILLGLILVLFYYRRQVRALFPPKLSMAIVLAVALFSFGIQFYVLTYLPVVDCLPYKKGNNIPEKMKIPAGALPDSTTIMFKYTRQGIPVEFDAEHFPEDFNDSLYQFVGRYDKLIRKGNAQPPIKDLVMLAPSGADTTQAILNHPGFSLVLFSRHLESGHDNWGPEFARITENASKAGIPLVWVSADAEQAAAVLSDLRLSSVPLLRGDLVAIKTAARANPTLYLLNQGTIVEKWSYARFDRVPDYIARLSTAASK
jgi:uncharacterized membrane protein YphA (DoxX/SURF4 family)